MSESQSPVVADRPKAAIADLAGLQRALDERDWGRACREAQYLLEACHALAGTESPAAGVIGALRQALNAARPAKRLPVGLAGQVGLDQLRAEIMALRSFSMTLANGDLSADLGFKGYLADALKMLQARLKHLTWQTQMVAKGDFSQRVDFMGEFAAAFNDMVAQLDEARRKLMLNEERYRRLSILDPLTGLYNRRHFYELCSKEFGRAERTRRPTSLVMLDVDRFKKVNDRHGHACGDTVLQEIAERMSGCLRESDSPARYGGEEFVVLLPESDLEQAAQVAERIRVRIAAEPFQPDNVSLAVTASCGVSTHQGGGRVQAVVADLVDDALQRADQALYRAKESGRNCVASAG